MNKMSNMMKRRETTANINSQKNKRSKLNNLLKESKKRTLKLPKRQLAKNRSVDTPFSNLKVQALKSKTKPTESSNNFIRNLS